MTSETTLMAPSPAADRQLRTGLKLLALGGGLVFAVGLLWAPQRVWAGLLMGFCFLMALSLAGPASLAFLTLAGARWSVLLERVAVALSAALPAAAALGLLLLFGVHDLYEWSHDSVVAADPILSGKAAYLNLGGFAIRTLLALGLWCWLARKLAELSRQFAQRGDKPLADRRLRWSAASVALIAVSFSLASMDWLMSLEPHWFSTLFPLLQFASVMAVGVAAAILLSLYAERRGLLGQRLRDEHLHDLGKLLFAMTLVWAYCWYCQYMLIWYTDMPEETTHYALRQQGPWWLLVQATLVIKWGLPFVALLARSACRNRKLLARVAWVVLAGHALDLYVQVEPVLMGAEPVLGLWELGPLIGAVALFFLVALRSLEAQADTSPVAHPHLEDCLHYQTP